MPRKYKRKSNRGDSWSQEDLEKAMIAVKTKDLSLSKASKTFNIPKTTLGRHVHEKENIKFPGIKRFGRDIVLGAKFEVELEQYIIKMQQMFHGLCPADLRLLAYDLAQKNNIPHPFNDETGMAGKDWLAGYMKRHPKLSLREPEATSLTRATGFNKVQVGRFFDMYGKILETENFPASSIYNVDESGISIVQKPGKIIALKGSKQVGKITSCEKGRTHTVVCAMGATGRYVPPMIIYPRVRIPEALMKGAPSGAIAAATANGWIDKETFVTWLRHFQQSVNASKQNKVLLLLDNHTSHISISSVDFAREHGIVMLSIPPHTSHKLQPLDISFFGPLKTYYNRECDNWMRTNVGKRISEYEIASLFKSAYFKAATMENAVSGFKASGLHPFNPEVFTDVDYAPAEVTEQREPEKSQSDEATNTAVLENLSSPAQPNCPDPETLADNVFPAEVSTDLASNNEAITVYALTEEQIQKIMELKCGETFEIQETGANQHTAILQTVGTSDVNVIAKEGQRISQPPENESSKQNAAQISIFDIAPLPKVGACSSGRKRKAQKAEVLTSTPYRETLAEKLKMVKSQPNKKPQKKTKLVKTVGRSSNMPSSSKGKSKTYHCIYCKALYQDPPLEDWIECCECLEWCHEACSDYNRTGTFTCEPCRK